MEYKVEKLSDYIYDKIEFENLANQIYYLTDHLTKDYPKHHRWYFTKHLPGVGTDKREILFVKNFNNVCAVAFLKKDEQEKKICTFYVAEHGRNIGIGRELMNASFDYLNTTTPMITMPSAKVPFFIHFIHSFDWKITQIIDGYYTVNVDEVVFNGILEKVKNKK
jgi:GNAT superfamily N-acetyltransferase